MSSNSVCNYYVYLSEQIGFVGLEVDSHMQFHLITGRIGLHKVLLIPLQIPGVCYMTCMVQIHELYQ